MIVVKQVNAAYRARWNPLGTAVENAEEQYNNMEVDGEHLDVTPSNQLIIMDDQNRKIAIIPAGYWFMARKVVEE